MNVADGKQTNWFCLKTYFSYRESSPTGEHTALGRDIWYRINSVIVDSDEVEGIRNQLKGQDYLNESFRSVNSTNHQVFFREYPWHPSSRIPEEPHEWDRKFECPYWIPTAQYEWEGSDDNSIDGSIEIILPSPRLIRVLDLKPDLDQFDCWINKGHETVFQDPSVYSKGPQSGLVSSAMIKDYLDKNNKTIVWFVDGEKQVIDRDNMMSDSSCWGRMTFSSLLWIDGEGNLDEQTHASFQSRNF